MIRGRVILPPTKEEADSIRKIIFGATTMTGFSKIVVIEDKGELSPIERLQMMAMEKLGILDIAAIKK